MASRQDRPAPTSTMRRAATVQQDREQQMNVLYRRLTDVCGRLGAIPYPGEIQGRAIKTVADAVCDLEDIRNALPDLLGTAPA